jgi:hypothetical protein
VRISPDWPFANAAALIDIAPLYKYIVQGRDPTRLVTA